MDFMLLICLFLLLRCWHCGGRDVVTVVVVLVVRDSGFTVRVGLRGSGLKKFRFRIQGGPSNLNKLDQHESNSCIIKPKP